MYIKFLVIISVDMRQIIVYKTIPDINSLVSCVNSIREIKVNIT